MMEILKGFTPRKPKVYDEVAKYYCIEQCVRVRELCNTIMQQRKETSFICEIDYYFPAAGDQDRKEQLLNTTGKALLKFVQCFNKHYGQDSRYPLKKSCKYEATCRR